MIRHAWIVLLFVLVVSGTHDVIAQAGIASLSSLRFLGSYEVPYNQPFKGTTIGGLSGIDYDSKNDRYFLISDDRSAIDPARFYTAKIQLSEKGIDTVVFTETRILLSETGLPYPNAKQDRAHTPDPESIRYNAKTNNLVWTSEGERILNQKDTVLENPALTVINPDGKYMGAFQVPHNLLMRKTKSGPRQNGTLEGLTFADDYSTLYVSTEEPLFEDGPRADLLPGKALIRIFQFDVATQHNVGQYAYALETIAHPAFPPTAFKINGVPEILSLGNSKLLVVERSFSTGRLPCTVKVFLADHSQSTNIMSTRSLQENPPAKLVTKTILLNMDDLGIYIDNIEGVTVGPNLPNGHNTLLFVSDNNFNAFEVTQLLLFEVIP